MAKDLMGRKTQLRWKTVRSVQALVQAKSVRCVRHDFCCSRRTKHRRRPPERRIASCRHLRGHGAARFEPHFDEHRGRPNHKEGVKRGVDNMV